MWFTWSLNAGRINTEGSLDVDVIVESSIPLSVTDQTNDKPLCDTVPSQLAIEAEPVMLTVAFLFICLVCKPSIEADGMAEPNATTV